MRGTTTRSLVCRPRTSFGGLKAVSVEKEGVPAMKKAMKKGMKILKAVKTKKVDAEGTAAATDIAATMDASSLLCAPNRESDS